MAHGCHPLEQHPPLTRQSTQHHERHLPAVNEGQHDAHHQRTQRRSLRGQLFSSQVLGKPAQDLRPPGIGWYRFLLVYTSGFMVDLS